MNDTSVMIAGAAGQGVEWATKTLGRVLLRNGFNVYATNDHQSRIRGGHNFNRVRFGDRPLGASVRRTDFLLALNEESIGLHLDELTDQGLVFCVAGDKGHLADPRMRVLPEEVGPKEAGRPQFNGIKLLSMLAFNLGLAEEILTDVVLQELEKRGKKEIIEPNLKVIKEVFAYSRTKGLPPRLLPTVPGNSRILISGHEAVALGMIGAGVGVYVGYPMSPSTSILTVLAQNGPELGIAVEMAEDEIAAANIAIGASYAGVRAATGSSGGGLALMAEAIGMAGITETPVVIVDGQRSGPSTGMATRTEQSDLLFVTHISQGEFPRAILGPTDQQDAFYLTAEAFNIAEKWQIPVFIMTDHNLADSQASLEEFDLSPLTIDRGAMAPEPEGVRCLDRYRFTESGVSPRAFPVISKWLVAQDSHEHDEYGCMTDNPDNRVRQMDKRMRKLAGIADTFPGPELIHDDAEIMLICWGSTVGPAVEALAKLREQGHNIGTAIFRYLFPMNVKKVKEALEGRKKLLTIEANYTGQLGKLLLAETGIPTQGHIAKFDGRLFTVEDVISLVGKALGE